MADDQTIIIVGSRLQALVYAWSGVVAAIVLAGRNLPLGIALGALGTSGAALVAVRRAQLGPSSVTSRAIGGTLSAQRSAIEATFGHRYLTLTFPGGRRRRIEVPVEIHPEVR